MKKLDAFEEVTVKSYGEQVKTSAISENHHKLIADTNEWILRVREDESYIRREVYTDDGYKLVGVEFLPEDIASHKYVLVLHGYTGWKEEMFPYAKHYVDMGYHAIVPDMRCSGESEGDYIGIIQLVCNAWRRRFYRSDSHIGCVHVGNGCGFCLWFLLL